jgi:galactokinase
MSKPGPPAVTFRAPGRVNLIGDHTDYQGGLCLPVAIDRCTTATATARADDRVVVAVTESAQGAQHYVDGVVAALRADGFAVAGADLAISSDLPIAAGLSSSAALEVAVAGVLAARSGFELRGTELALVCQRAEHLASGVPCGVMDQMAIVSGRADHALLLDCRTLHVMPAAIPASLAIVVAYCGVARRLETSAYADRRAQCERAAVHLGVRELRDVPAGTEVSDPIARHVVTENARVVEFVDALHRDDRDTMGALLRASHASLRDDFRVSTPELDALVDALQTAGAFGARLTGAGFGGCVVALTDRSGASDLMAGALTRYERTTGITTFAFVANACDGAALVH